MLISLIETWLIQLPIPSLDPWLSNWFVFIWRLENGQWT
jgi:hypothetical protein